MILLSIGNCFSQSSAQDIAGFFAEMTRLRAISPKTPESAKKNLARVGAP
jgi:hypothetical protein